MNHFDVESENEEVSISYLPLHSAISYNGQKYFIPLDCEFYEIIFELEHKYQNKGFKIYNMTEYLDSDGINIMPIENYALVDPKVSVDDIIRELNIETYETYDTFVYELFSKKLAENAVEIEQNIYSEYEYKVNDVVELDNIEFKLLQVNGGELGAVLFHWIEE